MMLRALTYQPIAVGDCEFCKSLDVLIRLVYNPYGDDQLMCLHCGEDSDKQLLEDSSQENL